MQSSPGMWRLYPLSFMNRAFATKPRAERTARRSHRRAPASRFHREGREPASAGPCRLPRASSAGALTGRQEHCPAARARASVQQERKRCASSRETVGVVEDELAGLRRPHRASQRISGDSPDQTPAARRASSAQACAMMASCPRPAGPHKRRARRPAIRAKRPSSLARPSRLASEISSVSRGSARAYGCVEQSGAGRLIASRRSASDPWSAGSSPKATSG